MKLKECPQFLENVLRGHCHLHCHCHELTIDYEFLCMRLRSNLAFSLSMHQHPDSCALELHDASKAWNNSTLKLGAWARQPILHVHRIPTREVMEACWLYHTIFSCNSSDWVGLAKLTVSLAASTWPTNDAQWVIRLKEGKDTKRHLYTGGIMPKRSSTQVGVHQRSGTRKNILHGKLLWLGLLSALLNFDLVARYRSDFFLRMVVGAGRR